SSHGGSPPRRGERQPDLSSRPRPPFAGAGRRTEPPPRRQRDDPRPARVSRLPRLRESRDAPPVGDAPSAVSQLAPRRGVSRSAGLPHRSARGTAVAEAGGRPPPAPAARPDTPPRPGTPLAADPPRPRA